MARSKPLLNSIAAEAEEMMHEGMAMMTRAMTKMPPAKKAKMEGVMKAMMEALG